MHARAPAIGRALQQAALAQLPVYLHAIACVPVAHSHPNDAAPPRWHFVAVQKQVANLMGASNPTLEAASSPG